MRVNPLITEIRCHSLGAGHFHAIWRGNQGTPTSGIPARVTAVVLSDSIEGEARDVALIFAGIVRGNSMHDRPFPRPTILLSCGETTVTLRGKGRGGRNSEFLLSLAISIDGMDGITALAADTDGIDGSGDNAGAFVDCSSATRMHHARISEFNVSRVSRRNTMISLIAKLLATM